MNDFTKAELECLHNAIHLQLQTIAMSEINASRRRDMLNKIQSMIDNHCDHEEQYEDYNSQPMRCKNCLEITDE